MYINKINDKKTFFKIYNLYNFVQIIITLFIIYHVKYVFISNIFKKIWILCKNIDMLLIKQILQIDKNHQKFSISTLLNHTTDMKQIYNIAQFELNTQLVFNNFSNTNIIFIYMYITMLVFVFILLCMTFLFYQFLSKLIFVQLFNITFMFLFFISIIVNNITELYNIQVNFNLKINSQTTSLYIINFEFTNFSNFFSTTTVQIAYFCNLFSLYYMKKELKIEKFLLFLNFFVFSMIFFIHANNIILMFFFWEFIGITSFFLINFYDLRPITLKSAFKAFSFNRFSDVNFLAAISIYVISSNSISINSENLNNFLHNSSNFNFFTFSFNTTTLFSIFITLAAFCKSAQLGLHYWLPDSMEAPATASALIHSATLVSSGIFLLLKFKTVIINNEYIVYWILVTASLTAIFGAVVSSYQTDLKKILAYSTISNCGTLIASIFIAQLSDTLNYFYFHGISKSLSFLFVGYFITQSHHQQDIRKIGFYSNIDKRIKVLLMFTLMVLSAWPMTVLSMYKHNIVVSNYNIIYFTQICIAVSSIFSIIYSIKISFFLLQTHNKTNKNFFKKNKEYIFSTKILINYFLFLCICICIKVITTNNLDTLFINGIFFIFKLKILLWLFLITLFCTYTIISNNKFKILNFLLFLIIIFAILLCLK